MIIENIVPVQATICSLVCKNWFSCGVYSVDSKEQVNESNTSTHGVAPWAGINSTSWLADFWSLRVCLS